VKHFVGKITFSTHNLDRSLTEGFHAHLPVTFAYKPQIQPTMADLEANQPPSEQQIEDFFREVLEITDPALLLELNTQGLKSM
jgi:hypothetical protein